MCESTLEASYTYKKWIKLPYNSKFLWSNIFVIFVNQLPYSGLFSLGANFPEFQEWAHYSGKFILGCYMKLNRPLKFDLIWLAIAEIGTDSIMSKWPINI